MYSAENYMWGWILYCSGVLLMLFVLWYWMRKVSFRHIRHLFLLALAVTLLTPVPAYIDDPHLAPAIFVSLYEGIFLSDEGAGFQRGLAPVLAMLVGVIILYSLLAFAWRILRRGKRGSSSDGTETDSPTRDVQQTTKPLIATRD